MAHIPMNDITELWNQSDHNWKGLHQTLEQHRGKSAGISNTLVLEMLRIAHHEDEAGHSFPSSAQDLYNLLNQRLQASSH